MLLLRVQGGTRCSCGGASTRGAALFISPAVLLVPASFHRPGILASPVCKCIFYSLSTSLIFFFHSFVLKYNFKGITCCLLFNSPSTVSFHGKVSATLSMSVTLVLQTVLLSVSPAENIKSRF